MSENRKNVIPFVIAFLAGVVYAYTKNIPFPKTAQYGLMAARATLMSPKPVNPDIANILL